MGRPSRRVSRAARVPPWTTIVPQLVITAVTYLLGTRLGAESEVRFLGDLAGGNLLPEPVAPVDWLRIAELVAVYRDLALGTVDASVIAAAERLSVRSVATLEAKRAALNTLPRRRLR